MLYFERVEVLLTRQELAPELVLRIKADSQYPQL